MSQLPPAALSSIRVFECVAWPCCAVQNVVRQWNGYTLEQQREVFGAALMAASSGTLTNLDEDLQLALDMAAS